MLTPNVFADALIVGESARWHDSRLWLAHWGTNDVIAVDLDGNREVMAHVPVDIAFSIDWLPDGRLLVTAGDRLLRQEPDGSLVDHADLTGVGFDGLNEIVVDGRGNVYVNGGCTFEPAEGEAPGGIALVTPDGDVRQVADRIAFPNGMVVTPDNRTLVVAESFARRLTAFDIAHDGSLSGRRVWADGVGPDGICIDADGAIWSGVGGFGERLMGRVFDGGEVRDEVRLDRECFASTLGGPDGRTLFMLAAEWRGLERMFDRPYTGQILTIDAPAPAVGWP
jgi:sugar lactone lactonase YvrE